jgi:histidyl-tRNA synthetase
MLRAFLENGLPLRFDYEGKSLKSQMRYADGLKADFVFILGDDEISKGVVVLRNMKTKEQWELPIDPSRLPGEALKLIVKQPASVNEAGGNHPHQP